MTVQLMDDDPDGIGLLSPQIAGEIIGAIAHFPGHVRDPLTRPDIDGGVILQPAADGGGGKVEHFGYIVNGNIFFRDHIIRLVMACRSE